MKEIRVLEQTTIDKIAAGEVVERPGSIVKELCENALDAGASAVTVEIRDGGISMIRVTDNGEGIDPSQIRNAFQRHATSKIEKVDDLTTICSFGFRGEALSSISAVSRVELITKVRENLTGIRCKVEGGSEILFEEVGAPAGSTFIVRDLFYNTPARRKFLKSAQTEAGYISDYVSRLALSNPHISVKFMVNSTTRLSTSGYGSQADVINSVFGREIRTNLLEAEAEDEEHGMKLKGWIGKPSISRGNRSNEILYVNGRLVSNNIFSKALEEGYETFLMQHKFPFVILALTVPGNCVDVNVHPSKAQVRFSDGPAVYRFVKNTVKDVLTHRELIVSSSFGTGTQKEDDARRARERALEAERNQDVPEPFETLRREHLSSGGYLEGRGQGQSAYERKYPGMVREKPSAEYGRGGSAPDASGRFLKEVSQLSLFDEDFPGKLSLPKTGLPAAEGGPDPGKEENLRNTQNASFLTQQARSSHKLIGQLFETYWIIEYRQSMYIVDQHAAHEKVLFERLMEKYRNKQPSSQLLSPSEIVTMTLSEEALLRENLESFQAIGFEIEPFGDHDYMISAVPQDLFGLSEKDYFLEMLDSLSSDTGKTSIESVTMRVATMACKAAVKGNTRMSREEADALISELLTLDNPYNCPHGRPTILSMSKTEIEKKFHRIV